MRVTTSSLITSLILNINKNLERVHKSQLKMASGKELTKPSDNPAAVTKSLLFRRTIGEIEQYKINANESLEWLKVTESAMSEAVEKLNIARENVVRAANDSLSSDNRATIAEDIGFIINELVTIGNTTFAGRYVFSGAKTDIAPFDSAYDYLGDEVKSPREVSKGISVTVNYTASEIFRLDATLPYDSTTNSALGMLTELQNILYQESQGLGRPSSEEISAYIEYIDDAITNIMNLLTEVGTKVNNMEDLIGRHEETTLSFDKLLSQTEDADLAKVITELYAAENVYRSSLAAGARIIQPSLLDFLR